jgi:hypothetical protein
VPPKLEVAEQQWTQLMLTCKLADPTYDVRAFVAQLSEMQTRAYSRPHPDGADRGAPIIDASPGRCLSGSAGGEYE